MGKCDVTSVKYIKTYGKVLCYISEIYKEVWETGIAHSVERLGYKLRGVRLGS